MQKVVLFEVLLLLCCFTLVSCADSHSDADSVIESATLVSSTTNSGADVKNPVPSPDVGASGDGSDLAESEDVTESLGIYYNGAENVYWLTDTEIRGFLKLYHPLKFEKGIAPVPPGQGPPSEHFELHYAAGDWDYIFIDLHGLYHYENDKPTAFVLKDGQDDLLNELFQYLRGLDSIQNIPELKQAF